ncbi:hypothetical protein A1OE_1250 [Candidatus Endolissoclinum faulkneri L2]|uniref:Uncharacterized protein n=1 Tax=Candidatus Endolissoclinum faulkneri L2 TaxID=1193729 RepID=K7YSC4_9PROT|nr:hypothetical protein A1OE_1250 [Candidatus Endolissoclinum faulkneri L2]
MKNTNIKYLEDTIYCLPLVKLNSYLLIIIFNFWLFLF